MIRLVRRIRFFAKKIFDKLSNERLKANLLQAIPFWVASLFTGLVAVLYTLLFSWAERSGSYIIHHYTWSIFLLMPICFLLAWWLVIRFAPGARGSGIPQVIAATELSNPKTDHAVGRLLNGRIIFVKIISSVIMVFGGGVVGREGPTIQIAGSIFRKVNQWLPSWWPKISKRNMIMTGAAAGLAAAFNTPLGGIVFTVEELTRTHISYFRTAIFTAVIIAGLTAQAFLGPYLYLGYPDVSHLSGYIFFLVILVAIVCGLLGSITTKIIVKIFAWTRRFNARIKQVVYIIFCGLIIASIAYFLNEGILGSGKELMNHALFSSDKTVEWYVPFLRIAGSVLSFTTGAAGGIFAPSLSAGAGIGAVMAGWFDISATDTNLLILAGMVSFLTGITRTPFTAAILVLEMTDRHGVIFHLMLAGMVASLASNIIDHHSLYDHMKKIYKDFALGHKNK